MILVSSLKSIESHVFFWRCFDLPIAFVPAYKYLDGPAKGLSVDGY